jgi:hypothetical protein
MSKCKTVQDEKKILELSVRQKSNGQVIEKKVLKSSSDPESVNSDNS